MAGKEKRDKNELSERLADTNTTPFNIDFRNVQIGMP